MRFRFPTLLGLALALSACGGGESSKGGGGGSNSGGSGGSGGGDAGGSGGSAATGGPVTLDEFADEYQRLLCTEGAKCCADLKTDTDVTSCRNFVSDSIQTFEDALAGGKAAFDGENAGKCLAAVAQAIAACTQDPVESTACQLALTGTVPEGGACTSNLDCIEPPGGASSCESGKCVQHPRGTAGTSCKQTCTSDGAIATCLGDGTGTARCYTNDGLYCDPTTSQCVAKTAVGGACADSVACVDGAYCAAGTCAAQKPVDSACTSAEECDETSAYCTSGQCKAKLALGASCVNDVECLGGDCKLGTCSTDVHGLVQFVCK